MGSGRCATHNCKLNRVIKEKGVSCVDKSGQISWTMREGTTLVCPKSGSSASNEGQNAAVNTYLREVTKPINKKQRICSDKNDLIRQEEPVGQK